MILSKKEILRQIKKGRIKIEPFDPSAIKSCSLDLTLSNQFAFPKGKDIIVTENIDFNKHFTQTTKEKLVLKPGDFILGITKEKITLPSNIAAFLSGRSRFARLGLQVHSSSSFVQPCVSNRQVFEIKNIGKHNLIVKPGLKVGQIIFMKVDGKTSYSGIFKNQNKII
ncbi:MAG: dCTP deaminase [Candidatus Pacearchaeota archaeon]|nr:dCTP deaminase [Candidatus Pacearchaeota archaeon]